MTGQIDYARDLGNKLFVYISYCFAGRAYPRGDINDSHENVRNQVFQCLCSQHSVKADDAEDIYPYLRQVSPIIQFMRLDCTMPPHSIPHCAHLQASTEI